MERDIIDRLEELAQSYEQSGPSAHHTAATLREAKMEILSAKNQIGVWHRAYMEARGLASLAIANNSGNSQ